MGSGKTSFGSRLAKKLKLPFYDLDLYIEQQTQTSINTLFQLHGEQAFRTLENELLNQFLVDHKAASYLLSTGGGTPCFHNNLQLLKAEGTTIYLKGNADFLAKRLKNSTKERPLIRMKSPEELLSFIQAKLSERETYYSQATITIDALSLNAERMNNLIQLLEYQAK